LSRSVKILIAIGLFIVLYLPVELVWEMVRPGYAGILAGVAEPVINLVDLSNTTYRVNAGEENFKIVARINSGGKHSRRNVYELPGNRKVDMVTYNMGLWATLFLATAAFLDRRSRLYFLIIAPLIIFCWHVCDLFIFAENTRWILTKDLSAQFPSLIQYSLSWNWIWYWAQELNRRIIDPFLPLLLWLIFCAGSFFGTSNANAAGRMRDARPQS